MASFMNINQVRLDTLFNDDAYKLMPNIGLWETLISNRKLKKWDSSDSNDYIKLDREWINFFWGLLTDYPEYFSLNKGIVEISDECKAIGLKARQKFLDKQKYSISNIDYITSEQAEMLRKLYSSTSNSELEKNKKYKSFVDGKFWKDEVRSYNIVDGSPILLVGIDTGKKLPQTKAGFFRKNDRVEAVKDFKYKLIRTWDNTTKVINISKGDRFIVRDMNPIKPTECHLKDINNNNYFDSIPTANLQLVASTSNTKKLVLSFDPYDTDLDTLFTQYQRSDSLAHTYALKWLMVTRHEMMKVVKEKYNDHYLNMVEDVLVTIPSTYGSNVNHLRSWVSCVAR